MQEDDNLPNEQAADEGGPAGTENESGVETEVEQTEGDAVTETDSADEAEGDGDDTEAEDESDEADDDDEGDKKPKKPSKEPRHARYQRQIDRLKAQLAEVSSRPGGSLSEADVANAVEEIVGKAPKEEDYKGDYLAFERALTAYELDKRQAAREVKGRIHRQQAAVAERRGELAEAHRERMDEFRPKAKDFDEVMKTAANLKASPVVEDLVLESDKSAHLTYYLAKNPDKLNALNSMTERQAAREIGRLESRLSLPPKKTTQAPPPVKPLKGAAAPASDEAVLNRYLEKTYGPRRRVGAS